MKQIMCRHCDRLIWATYVKCPRCHGATRKQSATLWYCGTTWLLTYLAIVSTMLL